MNTVLEVCNLTFCYEEYLARTGEAKLSEKESISDISFEVESGSFLLITGNTGSGKSTLLHLLKEEVRPSGKMKGKFNFNGITSDRIALLLQNPKAQCVTDKVWHELAFGLENEHLSQSEMELRIAETASFFDLEKLLQKNTGELSGGELQLVNLAALMVKRPSVLLLDEPTSQLDPAAEQRFLQVLKKIHDEIGITILMVEHNLSESLTLSTHMLVLEEGKLRAFGTTEEVLLKNAKDRFISGKLPIQTEVYFHYWNCLQNEMNEPNAELGAIPMSVRDGREFLKQIGEKASVSNSSGNSKIPSNSGNDTVLQVKDLWFRYHRTSNDVLRGIDIGFQKGLCYAILGGNGAGKTTFLRLLAGFEKPDEGKVKTAPNCKCAFLPQNPETLFLTDSLKREAKSMGKTFDDLPEQLKKYDPETHPYDLSGGEKELLALWKVLSSEAQILLLDEPQKGLDPHWRDFLKNLIKELCKNGTTVIMVTHDTDFAAETADEVCMISGGRAGKPVSAGAFFLQNYYYTTPTVRLTRGILSDKVTREDLLC